MSVQQDQNFTNLKVNPENLERRALDTALKKWNPFIYLFHERSFLTPNYQPQQEDYTMYTVTQNVFVCEQWVVMT